MSSVTFEDVVSQIKDRLDILDVVSKDVILKKSGGNYWGLCPFHKEKTPSFSVNPAKGIYKCFGCGEGGDALSYIIKTRGINFSELIKELASEFGLELPSTFSGVKNKDVKDQMIKACAKAAEFYQQVLFASSEGSTALSYLNNRGIDEKIIKRYSLGLASKEPNHLYVSLKDKFSDDVLEKAGLVLKSSKGTYTDRFRNRIIIPIHDEMGDIVAFGARALEEGQNPKYLNSSDSLIYNKSKILYGLYFAKEAIKQSDSVIVMEGYFDVISAQANGIENCVASCGTSLTTEHIKLISRYSKSRKIYLSFDTDSAGLKAAQRGAEIIKEAFTGLGNVKQFDESYSSTSNEKYACEIRVITPPEGKDPDEFIRTAGAKEYAKYLEHAPLLLDFQLNQVLKQKNEAKTPTEKLKLVKEIIPILAEIQNKIILSEYIKMVASALNIDEEALQKEIKKIDFQKPLSNNVLNPIVTKSSNIMEKAQKNLLSLYLINESHFTFQQINEMISNIKFDHEKLIIVKTTIDKLICTVNNVKALIEQLYINFVQDEEIKAIITDLICISETFNNLSETDFKAVIDENINKIRQCQREIERNEMRNLYKNVNDDDTEALKVQIQLRDKIKDTFRR
ncbi:MAG TPA: DNA primase [Candidatus Gastranaerophilaceae bacterium]|nr:DNA primase [Candidatus Gastranaerophilaceae bacterium]